MQDQEKKFKKQLKASDEQVAMQLSKQMKEIRQDIIEANKIAQLMGKSIRLQDIYISKFEEGSIDSMPETKDEVQVRVENYENGSVYVWSQEKFRDKLVEMRDAFQTFEDEDFKELAKDQDPFYEVPEPILLGSAYYMLGGLPYLLDNPRKVPIVAPNSNVYGEIHLNVVPCDPEGNEELDEDQMTDNPEDLLNERLDFKVKID